MSNLFTRIKHKELLIFFSCYLVFWFLISFGINIHPDSLDHWGWSQHLAFSYANHPPMIAYWMKFFSLIIQNKILAIKIGAVISSAFVLASAYLAAREFISRQAAFLYLLLLHSTFYYSLFSQFFTIEQPYNFFWFLCLFSLGKYLNTKQNKWLLLLGLFGALGASSKYIIVLFCIIFCCWLLWEKRYRFLLLNKSFWLAILIAILVFSPIIFWNYQREWIGFKFILEKGIKEKFIWTNLLKLQLSHLIFYSIFLTLPAWYYFFRGKFNELFPKATARFLILHTLIPIVFFSYSSFKGKLADPNWLNGAYISLYLLLAYCWQNSKFKYFIVGLANLLMVGVVVFILLFHQYQFDFVGSNLSKRLNENNGWDTIAQQTETHLQHKNLALPAYIITKHYSTGAAISFYLSNEPDYYVTQRAERELVSFETITNSRALVFIRSEVLIDINKIRKIFPQEWSYVGEVEARQKGKVLRKFQLWYKQPKSQLSQK